MLSSARAERRSVVSCSGLRKYYPDVKAVDGLDLEVGAGECFGLLGPNGAGKTTTIEILEGLTTPDAGEVEILGLTWDGIERELRERIGVSLQETQLAEKLTVGETVRLFASFYARRARPGRRAAEAVAGREARRPGRQALRRPEAAAGGGLRAGRRSRDPLPRRADDRPRSAEPAAALGQSSRRFARAAARCCSRRTTWTRPSACATASRSSTTASVIALGTPRELIAKLEAAHVIEFASEPPTGRRPTSPTSAAVTVRRGRRGSGCSRVDSLAVAVPAAARRGRVRAGVEAGESFHARRHARGSLRRPDRKGAARCVSAPSLPSALVELTVVPAEGVPPRAGGGVLGVRLSAAPRRGPRASRSARSRRSGFRSASSREPRPPRMRAAEDVERFAAALPRGRGARAARARQDLAARRGDAAPLYLFDATRPDARTARVEADDALQKRARPAGCVSCRRAPSPSRDARYIDFLVPGLLGMNLMGTGMWSIGFTIVTRGARSCSSDCWPRRCARATTCVSQFFSRLVFLVLEVSWCPVRMAGFRGRPFAAGSLLFILVCLVGGIAFAASGCSSPRGPRPSKRSAAS